MSAPVNYNPLTDPETLWATMADATAFFNSMNVSAATEVNQGVVKKAAATTLPLPDSSLAEIYYDLKSMRADGSIQVDATVVTSAAYQELVGKYAALVDHIAQLEALLKTAGILTA
jgi:hypothetical protein